MKHDAEGDRLWRKLLQDRDDTWITAVVADESGVYVHGTYRWYQQFPTLESFVRKYAHDGTLLWKFRDSEGNPDGYRIARIRSHALVLHDGHLYATSWRGRGSILRKFTLDGDLVWLVPASAVGSLAAGDGHIFGSEGTDEGTQFETRFQIWDTDGNLVDSFPTEPIAENGLAWHDGALYFCAREGFYDRDYYSLNKMQPDGTPVWRIPYGRALYEPQGCGVHVDDGGVTVAVNLSQRRRDTYPVNLTVRRYDFNGGETSRWDFPSLVAAPNAVSVLGDEVYIGGYDLETDERHHRAAVRRATPEAGTGPAGWLDARIGGTPRRARPSLRRRTGRGPGAGAGQRHGRYCGLQRWIAAGGLFRSGGSERQRPRRTRRAEQGTARRGDRRQRERWRLLHLELDADFEPIAAVDRR